MFTQWATRRVFKFVLKKRIGRYIRGDLDLEQLDVQLGSGFAQLNDVALNVDYINEQISDLSLTLREGSVRHITLKLQWNILPKINVELDGLELVFGPRKAGVKIQNKSLTVDGHSAEKQQVAAESDASGLGLVGGCTYVPVQEGVRVVANLVENLLLGMHVNVNQAIVAFEEHTDPNGSRDSSHNMFMLRFGNIEYGLNSSDIEESPNGEEKCSEMPMILTNAINFHHMTLELLHVSGDAGKVLDRPVSILQSKDSLSGSIKLSMPWRNDPIDVLKLDADISISDINLQVTMQQIQQLLSVFTAYGSNEMTNNEGSDTTSCSLSRPTPPIPKDPDVSTMTRETNAFDMLGSQSKWARSSILPGTRLISNWVNWDDPDKFVNEGAISEADFAASTEEFFDCFDGTRSSQASLSGSGLWTWTCSAFNAITAASSLASGSILISQESSRDVEYNIEAKVSKISISVKDEGKEHENINGLLDSNRGQLMDVEVRDQKMVGSWLSQSVAMYNSNSRGDYILVLLSSIDITVQVSQKHLEWYLLIGQIEAFEVKYQKENLDFQKHLNGDMLYERIGSSAKPLQALIEQSLPGFPVLLCDGNKLQNATDEKKICFLRLSSSPNLPAVRIIAKHVFPGTATDKNLFRDFIHELDIYSQPIVTWVSPSVIHKLQKLSVIVNDSSGDVNVKGINSGSTLPCKRNINLNLHVPSLRVVACVPYSESSEMLKDHFICIEVSAPREETRMLKVNISSKTQLQKELPFTGSLTVSFTRSSLYIISPFVKIEESRKDLPLRFISQEVLNTDGVATIEILCRSTSSCGSWIAEKAWNGIIEQQRGGIGGNSEFASATASELTNEKNKKIRQDIIGCSATYVHIAIPNVKFDLFVSQQMIVTEILNSLVEILKPPTGGYDISSVHKMDISQTSIALDVGKIKIIAHPKMQYSSSLQEALEGAENIGWGCYTLCINKFEMLQVMNLGMIKSANYFWLRHGNGYIMGLLMDEGRRELQLLTLRDDALGRGDGCGGNALATSSAGIEVSVISWFGGGHKEDMLVALTVRGCTFMAHGGRLDWLPDLISFFSEHEDKRNTKQAICENFSRTSESETGLLLIHVVSSSNENINHSSDNRLLFSLDLHDVALCYEPGKEAVSAANLRARNLGSSDIDQFTPVACAIAASAVHVSCDSVSNATCKEYQIWLREVALLLNDTTVSEDRILTYTPEALRQAGYCKVAREAVMKAVVLINGENGLKWEVACSSNQLRLDTCHDTTAALARLIAQLQQLFMVEVEPATMEREGCLVTDCIPQQSSVYPYHNLTCQKFVSGEDTFGIWEGALTFARDSSAHAEASSSACVQLSGKKSENFEMLGISDFSSSEDSLYSSSGQDFCTPLSQNDEAPSFIEDYYIAKKLSPFSSQTSSWKGSFVLSPSMEHSNEDFSSPAMVEGSGGWYDGHGFNVVENHVPVASEKLESAKQKGAPSSSSNKRPVVSPTFPQPVGRVVIRDSNLRWRLHGGSDWPNGRASQTFEGREASLEIIFSGVELQRDTFPETGHYASRLTLSVQDVRVFDCSKDAPWKKVLGYYRSRSWPRESSSKSLSLDLESVRPDPMMPLEEYRLYVQLLPLRLHLDQRQLDFFINFFSPPASRQQLHSGYEEISSPNLADLEASIYDPNMSDSNEEALLPFFQICEVQPFRIRVDYVPRHVDIGSLRSGNYAELFNLFPWRGIDLELKRVRAAKVHGWEALSGIVVGEWLEDISHNQIHKFLKGLAPIRPLYALGSGAAKLVVLPAEHYRRDRRSIFRGMRKGAIAFLRSISVEAVGLGVQIASGAHEILVQTESALGSGGLSSSMEKLVLPDKPGQPGDMREGLQQACESLTRGLERTASSLISNPLKTYQRGGGPGYAVASALRAAPAAAVAPAAAAAGAVHRALLGVRNSLDPEHRRDSEEKYADPPPE